MKITLRVKETGGDAYHVTTTLGVIIAWERKYKRRAGELGEGKIGYEDLAFFAYESAKIAGQPVPVTLDGFIGKLEELEVVEAGAANPTGGDSTVGN